MPTLNLTIAGLFLMVEDGDLVHLIAPFSNAHGHGHAPHDLWFVYPAASGKAPDPMLNFSLDFRQLRMANQQRLQIPSTVVDLAAVVGAPIAMPRPIIDLPDNRKAAHFILKGGAMTVLNDECCRLPTAPDVDVIAAGQVMWTVSLDPASPTQLNAEFVQNGATRSISLPVDGSGDFQIGVVHTLASYMPATLEKLTRDRAINFKHFASMFQFWPQQAPVSPMKCGMIETYGSSQCTGTRVKAEMP